ncbi:MAG: carbohydrate-binding family 9-like protein [Clostridia bacterium]|nr:carbohydrate-binding family 9-like protein [Clostridia bacterium]
MRTYESPVFQTAPDWDAVPVGKIDCFQWEAVVPFRPKSFFQCCFVRGGGVLARLWSLEPQPRAVCTRRDDPVYEDSCLEVFFQPFPDLGYLNVEMNPQGVFLAEVGTGRENRVLLKDLTAAEPVVTPFSVPGGWGAELCLPCVLLTEAFGRPFTAAPGQYRGNFYKCGDKTPAPHYGSFAPMRSNPPGFHDPDCFATLCLKEERYGITEKNR